MKIDKSTILTGLQSHLKALAFQIEEVPSLQKQLKIQYCERTIETAKKIKDLLEFDSEEIELTI